MTILMVLEIRSPEIEMLAINFVFELHYFLSQPIKIEKVILSIKTIIFRTRLKLSIRLIGSKTSWDIGLEI